MCPAHEACPHLRECFLPTVGGLSEELIDLSTVPDLKGNHPWTVRPGEKRVDWIGPSSRGWGVALETKSVAGLGPLGRRNADEFYSLGSAGLKFHLCFLLFLRQVCEMCLVPYNEFPFPTAWF